MCKERRSKSFLTNFLYDTKGKKEAISSWAPQGIKMSLFPISCGKGTLTEGY